MKCYGSGKRCTGKSTPPSGKETEKEGTQLQHPVKKKKKTRRTMGVEKGGD